MAISPAAAGAGAADARVVTAPGAATAGYATAVTAITKGGTLSYLNLDIVTHDVVSVRRSSTGAPIFRSALVGLGKRTPVNGTTKLAKGQYDFYCSLHPNMKGKLRVL
jgi:plastocyanin